MRFKVTHKRDSLISHLRNALLHPIVRLFLAAAVLSGTVLLVRAYNRAGAGAVSRPPAATSRSAPAESPTTQKGLPSGRVEVELITVTADGLVPKAITRPSGQFLLAVENRSGLREVSLRLDSETANRADTPLINALMTSKTLNLKHLIDPLPGTYLLTEASHPDWVCRVTVTK